MEPMDTDEGGNVTGTAENLDGNPAIPPGEPMVAEVMTLDLGTMYVEEDAGDDEGARTDGVEGAPVDAAAAAIPGEIGGNESVEAEEQGVTVEAAEAASCPPGQLGVSRLTERFGKMVTGVVGGPRPSGDKAVESLNLQDLKDLNQVVVSFKVTTNAAVLAACANLDERESRGFLAADLHGVELLPGCEAPTEGHTLGQRVEELLAEANAADDRLRGANRTRKSKLRGKSFEPAVLQEKLAASDAKFDRDRAALWSRIVELEMPSAPI
eukprot:2202872-Prymnesium_polylepis.1